MFNPYYKLVFCVLLWGQGFCFPVENDTRISYDQKQSGEFNIHININDATIIDVNSNELGDDTINDADEYYYDEEDLTIKPLLPSITGAAITPEKEQMHELSVNENKNNVFNYTAPNKHTIIARKVTKPVIPVNPQNELSDNIPVPSSRRAQLNTRINEQIVNPKIQRKWESYSNIDLLPRQIFNKPTGCNSKYGYTSNRNCRKLKYSKLINSLRGLVQLMKTKGN